MCRRIALFAAAFGLPFAIADLARFDIQHSPTQTTPAAGTAISESRIHRYNAYASRITNPPAINPQQLFGRQTVQTADNRFCAYANGDGASPIYCPNDYTCTYLGAFSTAWGCCNARGCVNAPRTCFEEGDPNNYCSKGGIITIDCDSILTSYTTCTGNKPKCATYVIKTNTLDPQDTGGPESWSCAASATQIFVFFTPIANADARVTYTDVDADVDPTGTATSKSPTSTSNASNDTDKGNNKAGKNGLDIGAIIGIIVAVLGVLATVMVGLFPRQMTRCLTCGLRPKKDQTNEEIRKNFWLFISGRGAVATSQLHIHYHNTPVDQSPLAQTGAPIGLSPIVGPGGQHQGYWPQQQQQQQQQGQWGYAGHAGHAGQTGYEQHPPPAYQQGYGHGVGGEYISPAQYAAPQGYAAYEQQQPFLEMEDTGKKK
ncbi:hypothetical protein TWF481_005583 [Arthrobotrys musiformis]|uniref:Mid2 domain-containing protein n=1 Tax=Arthrobotrys musiformis TaxID=47236 RepID=A0AAV9WFM1_9PEZI